MKIFSIINKSIKEQLRQYWIFILTITMAPFFVCVYYLIIESSKPHFDILLLNEDKGITTAAGTLNFGNLVINDFKSMKTESIEIPLSLKKVDDKVEAIGRLKNRKAEVLIIIPENFSRIINNYNNSESKEVINIEFVGDLTNMNYMIAAIWANELINEYLVQVTQQPRLITIKETSLGISGNVDDFDLVIPGILILSIIMLMFTATIAIVTEVENKTMLRLKLSHLSAFEFLIGISIVQILVGITAIVLTLLTAVWLGFDYAGSIAVLMLIAVLTSISIIAFSLILSAVTKTVNEVLIVGNFPLFLFMFFTGAAFPIKGNVLFTVADYPITLQGFMSPTHAINALNKVLIMNMSLNEVVPEIVTLIVLTVIYFIIGIWAFKQKHMKVI